MSEPENGRAHTTDGSEEDPTLPLVPVETGVDPLLLALLHTTAFLDLSEDDIVEPELATEVLERVGHYVQRLPPERLQSFADELGRLADHGRLAGWPPEMVGFVEDFLYACGVGGDDDDE